MYVTRPLSLVLKSAEILAAAPDGPNSGYLVIQDKDSGTRNLKELPFPQDKELIITHGDDVDQLFLIPALNHPLSSNLYYAIVPHNTHKGEAFTCSREEDKETCCFCTCITGVEPRPLDPANIYQQFQILPYHKSFTAISIASDGFPPSFLGQEGWTIRTHTPENFKLGEARGLDSQLRSRLPELELIGSTVSVGKWYTPFVFVRDGTMLTRRDQVKRSMYYEVTLEQRWDRIYSCRRNDNQGNFVLIDDTFEKEQVFVGGSRAKWNERSAVTGVVWFKAGGGNVGLRVELVERMKWEAERGGWNINGGGGEEKIIKVEEFQNEGGGGWNEFGYYVLVERFNLRRMDGSLVMSYDFKHFHHFKTKWE